MVATFRIKAKREYKMKDNSRKSLRAEVIEHRGRITRVKFAGGLIGSVPMDDDMPLGSLITIVIEKKN